MIHFFLIFYPQLCLLDLLGLDRGEQQDPQEFYKLFLTRLESYSLDSRLPAIATIPELITGREEQAIECMKCHYRSTQEHPFHELEVSINFSRLVC